jgi:hypothetical protein
MTNKPTCHPENHENGQQTITLEHRRNLTEVVRYAEILTHEAQTARFASYYNDDKRALRALNEARIYAECIMEKLKTLPPTIDFPENEQHP